MAKVAGKSGLAVATSYNGKGVVDESAPISVGMLGTWGCKAANNALRDADLVIAIGASLGPDYMRFCEAGFLNPQNQTLVQIDIDPRNSGWVYPVKLSITGDAGDALEMLQAADLGESKRMDRLKWIAENNLKSRYGVIDEYKTAEGTVHNVDIVRALDQHLTDEH